MSVGGDAASLSISVGDRQKPYRVHNRESRFRTSPGLRRTLMCFTRVPVVVACPYSQTTHLPMKEGVYLSRKESVLWHGFY